MPRRRHVGLAAAIVSSTILGTALPAFVAHADSTTLYVNNAQGANCSDTGTGTQAQPFCTVQTAANVVQPGQTVQIANGTTYPEQVTVTHSGTPGNPIVFNGGRSPQQYGALVGVPAGNANAKNLPHAFVLSGVHDVTVTGFRLRAPQEALLVAGSDRIVLDGNLMMGAGIGGTAFPSPAPAIRLTGTTTATTVSRNRILSSGAQAVAVDAGVSGSTVTTNAIANSNGTAIAVTDAPGAAVTSNTIIVGCHSAIALDGNSANSTIENNVITENDSSPCPDQSDLSVSAASASGTKADYNDLPSAATGRVRYAWGTGSYTSLDSFRTATGQAGHDIAESLSPYLMAVESGATDSADANAPGELATDIGGSPRVDDANVTNSGTGVGYYDRGAFELQDPLQENMYQTSSDNQLGASLVVGIDGAWGAVTGTLDFGDGSPKAAVNGSGSYGHTYPDAGAYTATLSVTDSSITRTTTATVVVNPPSPLYPDLSWNQDDTSVPQIRFSQGGSSPWAITSYTLDFGDGSPKSQTTASSSPAVVTHRYPGQGTYTVTYTVTDAHGRSVTTTYPVKVGILLPLNRTIEAIQNDQLSEISNPGQQWYDSALQWATPWGMLQTIHASAMSFTYGPSNMRVIEAIEGDHALHEVYWNGTWHDNAVPGAGGNISSLSFSYSPSGARVVEAIESGVLHEIYSDPSGNWHDNAIPGVAANVSAMSFSYSPSGARVIEANESGVLHEIYSDPSGNWHDNPVPGVAPNVSTLGFTYNPAGQRVIEAVENGVLHEVYSDLSGNWYDNPVPGAGNNISNLSVKVRPTGDRVIEAVENNELHEIYTNAGNWTDSITPNISSNVTAVSLTLL